MRRENQTAACASKVQSFYSMRPQMRASNPTIECVNEQQIDCLNKPMTDADGCNMSMHRRYLEDGTELEDFQRLARRPRSSTRL